MTLATTTSGPGASAPEPEPVPEGHVRLTIDGVEVIAPKNELVIRAAERIGTAIPRFCDHPLLEPVGACRQCLVEVEMGGRPMPKPQAACTQTVADGMVVKTQVTSPVAEKAQRSNLEFLLLNHPLDCPICDKGGECPLQNQTMANGAADTRLVDPKRVFTKPIAVSTEILLDRERCVLCQRCTRFSDQIAGDRFIDLLERGSKQQIGISSDQPFQSYFSGNTIQICPVGALTSTAYRFRSRPFDLVSTPAVCEHCAGGCALRVDHRSNQVLRRPAGDDPEVNEEWNCDKGRFAFAYTSQPDRITRPLVRNAEGVLEPTSWTNAMAAAAAGLTAARDAGGVGVLAGGRLTVTDAYAYAKFARLALRTNDIDFRARVHSAEEEAFLAARVVGSAPETGGVTFTALESAAQVLLVALEPEEESGILFLRLRKASRKNVSIASVAALTSRGLAKMNGLLLPAAPGQEASVLAGLDADSAVGKGLRTAGAVILVGERAAGIPGLLTAVGELADATGAQLAWVPRRAGERGALQAGALPSLLPGGRPVADRAARAEVERIWGSPLPQTPGRDGDAILASVGTTGTDGSGEQGLAGLLIGGVELEDLSDPAAALAAVAAAGFVVSLELRHSAVTELADVVFPVAAAVEKSGAYVNWEGRVRPFPAAMPTTGLLDDARVLDTLGVEMDVDLYTQTPAAAAAEIERLGPWTGGMGLPGGAGRPVSVPAEPSHHGPIAAVIDSVKRLVGHHDDEHPADGAGEGPLLASWRMNLDGGRLQDGEPNLAGTAKADVAYLSGATAARYGLIPGDRLTISGPDGSVRLPLAVTAMVDGVVWAPGRVGGRSTIAALGVRVGGRVDVSATEVSA